MSNTILFRLPLNGNPEVKMYGDSEHTGYLEITGFPKVRYQEQKDLIILNEFPKEFPPNALLALLANRFCRCKKCEAIILHLPASREFATKAIRLGIADTLVDDSNNHIELRCGRQTFWQNPLPWLTAPFSGYTALEYHFSGEKRHPRRPPTLPGEVYRRYIPGLDSTFSLRTIDPVRDLETFNRWMNLEQVAFFWDQTGSLEEHASYLVQMLEDSRVHPLVGSFDGEPFAYFEVYWCKEDRIAPFYDAQDYDRGWHVAIGESKHQGLGKLRVWFNSLMHYMFLDEPRTQRIMGEPRIDHVRQIEFLKSQGYGHLKNIQLPHKKAALLLLEREFFFEERSF